MLWNQTLIPTLRDDPQEAEIPSHRLMLRAGLMRRLSGGLYTFLPLGLRALRKVEAIVRDEMDRAGALEVLMPALQPAELWETSGRIESMRDVMFHVNDRQSRHMTLGPTHEEVITHLVSHEIASYRQLPKTFYQIQTKFRDEIRPRFGLMRSKEFIMKDGYSFDLGWDEADKSYQLMYDAYVRIFERCGLATKIVEADTGAMGGQWSHEFMVLADAGEDGLVECTSCSYAANLERAERSMRDASATAACEELPEEVATPGMKSIEEVAGFLKRDLADLVKTMIYVADDKPVAVCVAGDRDVNETKLARVTKALDVSLADDDTIERVTGAPVGFAGPVGLKGVPVFADMELRGATDVVTGANKGDAHLLHVDLARDTGIEEFHDLTLAREGDACPRCEAPMQEKRGIEVGHVFKLGTKYSEAFGATYLDENSALIPMVMGCYGIGVTRTLQAVVEQSHDDNGIVWPMSVAPYRVALLLLDPNDEACIEAADNLTHELEAKGLDVLVDDRDERPGVKFKDADLIGFPLRVVIGRRGLAKGSVEVKGRTDKDPTFIELGNAAEKIADMCRVAK